MNYIKSSTVTATLIVINILLMVILSYTPVAYLFSYIFSTPLIGIIITGLLLSGGYSLADKGIKKQDIYLSLIGIGLVVFTFSGFGSSILQPYNFEEYIIPLIVSGLITTGISLLCGYYVLRTNGSLERYKRYSTYSFIGVLLTGGLGLLYTPIYVLSFILVLVGFITDLIYQIWMRDIGSRPELYDGFALYVAYIGIFVQILQIVIQFLGKPEN